MSVVLRSPRRYVSLTKRAIENKTVVIANVAMKPKATTLLYKIKTAAKPATIKKTFKPSAINALVTAVAGSPAGLRNANHAAAKPAVMLIAPPSAAEIAPCVPAIQPSTTIG